MPVSLTTTPQYPGVGKPVRVEFVANTGNFLRGYFTDAPSGSEAKSQLLKTGASRVPAFITDANKPWEFIPDVGGIYTLQIEQYAKGASTFGGGYQDSPSGFVTETFIDSTVAKVDVGQKLTQRIGFGADTATLTVFIVGDSLRSTLFETHGFVSPLISDAKSAKALTASLNPGVIAAVAAMVDYNSFSIIQAPGLSYDFMLAAFNSHIGDPAFHPTPDTDNSVSPAYTGALSQEGLKQSVAQLLRKLDQHMRNDDGGSSTTLGGTGTRPYHLGNVADWSSALLTTTTGGVLETYIAFADLHRAMTAHFANASVHTVPDTVNGFGPLLGLPLVHSLFLAEIQKQSPTAPASVNAGVTALVFGAGFEEV